MEMVRCDKKQGNLKLTWDSLKDSHSSGRRHESGVYLLERQKDRAGGVLRFSWETGGKQRKS